MNIPHKNYLAIDTSYDNAMVVLFNDTEILFEQALPERNAHSRNLCSAINVALEFALPLDAVLVGLGPGSFIGIRIALATALGFSFGRNLPLMGFCSHLALAHSLPVNAKKLALIMKASGDLSYASVFVPKQGQWAMSSTPTVVSPADFAQISLKAFVAGNRPDVEMNINGPSAMGVYLAAKARLAKDGIVDESDFIRPNYVKEPSVTLPSPPKKSLFTLRTIKSLIVPRANIAKSFFEAH